MGFLDRIFGRTVTQTNFVQPSTTPSVPVQPVKQPFAFELVVPEKIQFYFSAKTLDAQSKVFSIGPELYREFFTYLGKTISDGKAKSTSIEESRLVEGKIIELNAKIEAARNLYLENINSIVFESVEHINQYKRLHGHSELKVGDNFAEYCLEVKKGKMPNDIYLSHIIMDLINNIPCASPNDTEQIKKWGLEVHKATKTDTYIAGKLSVIDPTYMERYLKLKSLRADLWDYFIRLGLVYRQKFI